MTVVFARRLGPAVALTAAILCLASASTPVGAIGRLAGDALLARASAAAVRGVVVAVSAERDPSVDTIYTHVHLAVTRAWGFPTPPAVVELKLLGGATATQVLVVGGIDPSGNGIATAELVDPATGIATRSRPRASGSSTTTSHSNTSLTCRTATFAIASCPRVAASSRLMA